MRAGIGTLAAVLAAASCGSPASDTAEPLADSAPRTDRLTIDRVLAGPSLTGTSPSSPAWAPGGERLAFLWNDAALPRREIWMVEADGSDLRRLTSEDDGGGGIGRFAWTPGGESLVYLRSGALWRTDLEGSAVVLTPDARGASSLDVSPDGRFVSFLKDGDLWLFETTSGELRQATSVGVPSISKLPLGRYHRPDVEIGSYVWGGPTYAWSPDGRTIAVHHVDRRNLRVVHFPDYLAEDTDPNPVRRGYPGDPNELRTVGFLGVDGGDLTLLDLPGQDVNRIVDFSWSPDGRLLIDRESDVAVDRWLHVVDPADGVLREVWHDSRATRVYNLAGSAWHPDGEHVLFLGDLDDRYGLYMVGGDRTEPLRLTDPAFDVTGGPQVVDRGGGGAIYFQSNEPSPYERHVFRLVPGGGGTERVTTLAGQNRAYPSPDGSTVAILHSSDTTPTELYLAGPTGQRRITDSPPEDFDERPWARVRYTSFPSRADGATVHARILEPRDLDRSARHPVVFGPVYSNTVRNRWGGRWALIQQVLIERGYLVVQVDVRGSTGYGRAFREGFLVDFAGTDVEDLQSAVEHVQALPYVDPGRIGVWGSSYGGTLTVYSLLKKPGLFRAGVACASAVDPHFFGADDVAIVRRPESHPEAFERGAAQYAGNLEDELLLIHGMQDQVVPFKTVAALAEELMRQGKDFDFAFAPAATHGWTGRRHVARYLLGKLVGHFDRHLGGAN
ncbi:MAG: prolyl oligopeptidase family serine peptidase [Planctomycetota bacterium]